MKELLTPFMPVLAMMFGMMVHISKKAAEARLADATFKLKDYLLSHPYQTFTSFGLAVGAYFQLTADPTAPVTLFAAFTAGVAVNSLADLAPGKR